MQQVSSPRTTQQMSDVAKSKVSGASDEVGKLSIDSFYSTSLKLTSFYQDLLKKFCRVGVAVNMIQTSMDSRVIFTSLLCQMNLHLKGIMK